MWSKRDALDSIIWEAACDDLGIYPRATIKDSVETPRTEWQDGWNAAVMGMTERHGIFTGWVKTLTAEQRAMVTEMLDSDGEPMSLHVHEGDKAVSMSLFCSDTFMYACADAETFVLDDLTEIFTLWKKHGFYGTTAWIARQRRMEPVKEYRYTAGYLAAKADLVRTVSAHSKD